ncbi:hypothetical protein [Streptomyces sp. NPDC003688]
MGDALELFGGGSARSRRRQVVAQQERQAAQADLDLFSVMSSGKQEEMKSVVRKRLTETGMADVTDVGQLARQLAGEDAYLASLLIPIVQEYARTTQRTIREFGRGTS